MGNGKTGAKYASIKGTLLERIAARQYTEEVPVPPERVLAKEFGVAPMTVRRAIQELVAEGVLVRHAGRGRGTFVDTSARRAARLGSGGRRLGRVGIVYHHDWDALRTSPVYFFLFLEVQGACARGGVRLEFLPAVGASGPGDILRLARRSACQVLLVLDWPRPADLLEVEREGLPTLVLGGDFTDLPLSYVMGNDYQGACAATRYLMDLGHERVGIVNARRQGKISADRQMGWRKAVGGALAADSRLLYLFEAPSGALVGEMETQLAEQFRQQPPPSALFVRDGLVACAVVHALREVGLRCPEDVSVACVGGSFERSLSMPRITKAVVGDGVLGGAVLHLAEDFLTGRQEPPVGVVLPMRVVEGVTARRVGLVAD